MSLKSLIVFAPAFVRLMFAADPWVGIGTWRINLEKSKLANPAALKGSVMTIEAAGDHKMRITQENPKTGKTVNIYLPDGKEHPQDGSPGISRVSQHTDELHS